MWKVVPPAASAEEGEPQRGKGQQQQQQQPGWRGEVVAEWGKGDVTVGKVEVSFSCDALS